MSKDIINLGNPIYDSYYSIFTSGARPIKWFAANATSVTSWPIEFNKMQATILGVAHLIPDLKMYPEQAYNNILAFEDLPHYKHLKPMQFEKKSNSLKFKDIGRNIKSGYTYSKGDRRLYSRRTPTLYGKRFYEHIQENTRASVCYKNNRILNQPANTLGLMIIDSYIEDDNISVMDLIFGKTDYERLKVMNTDMPKHTDTAYFKTKYDDYSKYRRFVNYTNNSPLILRRSNNHGIGAVYLKIKGKPKIDMAYLNNTFNSTSPKKVPCAISHMEISSYIAYVTYFDYYGVTWDSLREKDVVILKGDKLKNAKPSFTELKIMDNKLNTVEIYRRDRIFYPYHDKTITSSYKWSRVYSEPYHRNHKATISFQEKYHTQKRYMEGDTHKMKEEDRYSEAKKMLDDTATDELDDFNLVLKNTNTSNINCTVLTSLLMARFERYCITDEDKLFKDGGLTNEQFVLYKHFEEDMAHIIPEVSPAGIEVLLKIVKRTISEQITSLTPAILEPAKTQISLFSVEDSTTLQFWIVRLFFYCKRTNMLDKDFFPYFVPHLQDESNNRIESIRMDISRGKECKYLIPLVPMISYNFSKLDKDDLMLSFDRYLQILRPLIKSMQHEDIKILDYCYPIVTMSKFIFPDLYKSFFKDEIPKFDGKLDTNVKVSTLINIVKFMDQELITNIKHEYNPSNFKRRTMLKKLKLWDKSKHLDYSKTTLPTLSDKNEAGQVTYDIIDNGKVTKLKTISIGDKLRMLQTATDLLSNIDKKEESLVYTKLYTIYILPVVNSLKNDDLVTKDQFSTRLDDMLKVKHSLDYIRNVNLSFLRKRKATLKKLFDAQKNTLKTVLLEDKKAQEDFFNSISDMSINTDELKLEPSIIYDSENIENIDTIERNIKQKEDIDKFNSKFGLVGLSAVAAGATVGLIANKTKKKGK